MLTADAPLYSNSNGHALRGIHSHSHLWEAPCAAFAVLFLLISLPLHAQYQLDPAQEVGLKPYGSYHGGNLDAANMMNGNLTVRIPLYSLPQLGKVGLSFSIVLNNGGWGMYQQGSIKSGNITQQYYRNSPLGAQLILDQDIWPNQFYGLQSTGTEPNPSLYGYEGFQVVSGDYSRNALAYDSNTSAQLRSVDGTGYLFIPQASFPTIPTGWEVSGLYGSYPFQYYWLNAVALGTLYTPGGNTYIYTTVNNGANTSDKETISDPDGNSIAISGAVASEYTPWEYTPWQWATQGAALNGTTGTASVVDSMGRNLSSPQAMTSTLAGCPVLTATNQPLVGSSTWNVPGPNGSTSTYLLCYATVTVNTGFTFSDGKSPGNCSNNVLACSNNEYSQSSPVLQSIVLPNDTYYGFVYDSAPPGNASTVAYGDLLQMIFPDGGTVSYTYGSLLNISSNNSNQTRYVQTRTMQAGAASPAYQWQYTFPTMEWGNPYSTSVVDPAGNETVYTYSWYESPSGLMGSFQETNRQVYQGLSTAGTLLQGSQTAYYEYSFPYTFPFDGPTLLLPSSVTSTTASGLTSTETYQYDSGFMPFNPVCLYSSDSWSCSSTNASANYPLGFKTSTVTGGFDGSTMKTDLTPYYFQTHSSYLSANMLNLPAGETVQSGGGTQLASTSLTYDESGYVASTTSPLGHITTTSKWIGGSTYAKSHSWWNGNGTLEQQVDPNGTCTTTYAYSTTYASAYPTGITNCLNQTTSYEYDFNTGQKTQAEDPNEQKTIYTYSDPLGRLTGVNYPDGGSTGYQYNDNASPPNVMVKEVMSSATTKSTEIVLDGFGRQVATQLLSDLEGMDEVDTTYDGLGRVHSVSNPYRSTSDATYGTVTYTYDALSRKTTQVQQDSTVSLPVVLEWCYDGVATAAQSNCLAHIATASGEWVDSADENGNDWERTTDALERLTSVIEPNGTIAPPSTIVAPSTETDYCYDALGNLTYAMQSGGSPGSFTCTSGSPPSGARVRSFSYDGLSRLVAASNPENASATSSPSRTCSGASGASWTTCYGYDSNSNLSSKVDNRNVTISYAYDALNRLLSKSYSDGTTPYSCYQYDASGTTNGKGRLSKEWTVPGSQSGGCTATSPNILTKRTITAYDATGRVLSEQQCTPNVSGPGSCTTSPLNPFALSYLYDLSGNLTAYTNGVNNVPEVGSINFGLQYDGAGRLQNLNSSWNPAMSSSGSPLSLFTADPTNGYTPSGAIQNMYLGDDIFVNKTYDKRLRTTGETATHP